jgi:hypothetical protein
VSAAVHADPVAEGIHELDFAVVVNVVAPEEEFGGTGRVAGSSA